MLCPIRIPIPRGSQPVPPNPQVALRRHMIKVFRDQKELQRKRSDPIRERFERIPALEGDHMRFRMSATNNPQPALQDPFLVCGAPGSQQPRIPRAPFCGVALDPSGSGSPPSSDTSSSPSFMDPSIHRRGISSSADGAEGIQLEGIKLGSIDHAALQVPPHWMCTLTPSLPCSKSLWSSPSYRTSM